MKVSRSGYYKWLKNKENLNNYELNRKDLGILIKDIHTRKPSYGYHRINAIIRRETGWIVSDNLVHKVCKLLNIKSKTRHYKYKKPGEESIKYSNQICGNWNTTRPFEKIVSDTTTFWFRKRKYDWTFYLDVFNNEIVGYDVRDSMHGNGIINHREALNDMLNNKIKRGYKELETIVHTDQGSVYSSVSFNNIFKSYMVTRSMSRAGTPYVFEDTTEIFSEEEAKRNEKGIVEIKSEQAFQKLMVRFMEKLSELDAKIETFAESELKPYLER